MAETVIFEQQTVSGFQVNSELGVFSASLFPAPFVIEAGKNYRVAWGSTSGTFTGVPFIFTDGSSCVSIGNDFAHGGSMGEEPFAIVYDTTNNGVHFFSMVPDTSYSIGVWLVETSGIIVKDRDGVDVTHVGTARIRSRTTDGGTKEFVDIDRLNLQDKVIAENGMYTADSGFDALGSVRVDVAGSGGSSLPAGVYWEEDEVGMPSSYPQILFVHNGALHCLAWKDYLANTKACTIYRRENNAWVTAFDASLDFYPDSVRTNFIEFNGKTHFFGFSTNHHVYDGVTLTKLNSLPEKIGDNVFKAFVQGEKLKYMSYETDSVFVWDEASDTWTLEAAGITGTSKSTYCGVFNADGKIYVVWGKSSVQAIGLYENGVLTQKCDTALKFTIENNTVFSGKYVYGTGTDPNKSYKAIAKMNLETGEIVFLGRMPHLYSKWDKRLCAPDCVRIYGITNYNTSLQAKHNLILHEVTE